MADILYKIGDYIEYKSEYYNGHGGFSYITKYGCIVSVNKYSYIIIKQYGGLNTYSNKIVKINHRSEHSSVYFSKCSKLLIFEDSYSSDMYSKSAFTMFNLDGKMIGIFEIHYNNFDCVFAKIK